MSGNESPRAAAWHELVSEMVNAAKFPETKEVYHLMEKGPWIAVRQKDFDRLQNAVTAFEAGNK